MTYKNTDLRGAEMGEVKGAENCDFSEANLFQSALYGGFQDCLFKGADLYQVDTTDCAFESCNFSFADMGDCTCLDTVFEKCLFGATISRGGSFDASVFEECEFRGVHFREVDFRGVTFRKCTFSGLFIGCNFKDASFQRCKVAKNAIVIRDNKGFNY